MSSSIGSNALAIMRILTAATIGSAAVKTGKQQQEALKRSAASAAALALLTVMVGGPRHKFLHSLTGTTSWMESAHVEGFVAQGFERVKTAFEENVKNGLERGAQFVVYWKGEKIIDLSGGTIENYYPTSTQLVFSCSKVISAIVIGMLVDRGLIELDKPVCEYWPEFAQNGKEKITVSDVLRHEAGLAYFDKKVPLAKVKDLDKLKVLMEQQAPIWLRSRKLNQFERMYHGNTRGFILNEIARQVSGKTIGELIEQEFAQKYQISMSMGKPKQSDEVSDLEFEPFHVSIAKSIYHEISGHAFQDDRARAQAFFNPKSHVNRWLNCFSYADDEIEFTPDNFFNHTDYHEMEVPSVNLVSNARSLAFLADKMSRGGEDLISRETWELLHQEPIKKFDHGMLIETEFNKGGFNHFVGEQWPECTQGYVGWGGLGGSAVAWNPEKELAVSYTITGTQLTSIMGFRDPRCINLMKAVEKSLRRLEQSKL